MQLAFLVTMDLIEKRNFAQLEALNSVSVHISWSIGLTS